MTAPARSRARPFPFYVLAALVYASLLAVAVLYLAYPAFIDHGEPSTLLIAWRLLQGLPAYPPFSAPERITNIYGPLAYGVNTVVLAAFGPSIPAGKAAAVAAAIAMPAMIFWSRIRDGWTVAAAGVLLAAGYALLHLPATVWNRPDSFVALCVAVALAVLRMQSLDGRETLRALLIALCAALAAGAKLHAALYFAPIVLFYVWERGLGTLILMGAAGALLVLAPFALPPFSLVDYLSWFEPVAAGKQNSWGVFLKVFRYSLFYFAPLVFPLLDRKTLRARDWAYVGAYAGCLVLSFFPASKPGAGMHYLLPFAPIAVDIALRYGAAGFTKRMATAAAAILALALLAVSMPIQERFVRALHWDEARAVGGEIRQIMADFSGRTIEMGVGDTVVSYPRTFQKTILVTAGHPYSLDAAIVTETAYLKIPLPPETVARIRACRTDVWLIPAGERPFAMVGYYAMPAFGQEFQDAFLAAYEKRRSYRYFDAWACRR
ncbi:MAG: hypothetical protein EXQ86_05085 [Rhodospirillales bacterium]|nr:hypothetical protein [Rhodospirillales bacterium]